MFVSPSVTLSLSGNSSKTISCRKMKHVSMDLSGIEECPIYIQISGGARDINEIRPLPTPPIFKFFIYHSIFMKLDR